MSASPNRAKCPICARPRAPDHAPFCSARCKDRDLVRWLDDGYAIPGPAADPDMPSFDGDEEH